eukprot:gene3991-7947_t
MSSLKKYKKVKYLGKGSYGAAILVELKSNSTQKFVIKEVVIGHLKESEQDSARKEAEVLNQMNHSNITMYIESFVENSKLYIVMEFADGGDLSGSVKQRKSTGKKWSEDEVMRIFVQICLALKHVHDKNILHRDLKSQNIFLTSKGIVKLGDFGIAKVLDASEDQARTQIGTPYYLSPEICESRPYGRSSDMWSLGVVLYELVVLELPFQAQSLPALIHKIISTEPAWSPISDHFSTGLLDLAKSLLAKDPTVRPSSRDTVKCELITNHISKLLSHTLKVGRGGAEGAVVIPGSGGQDSLLDAETADMNIERERARLREQSKERERLEAAAEKERQREEELKILKKLKQDKKAAAAAQLDDDDATTVVLAPRHHLPQQGGGGGGVAGIAEAPSRGRDGGGYDGYNDYDRRGDGQGLRPRSEPRGQNDDRYDYDDNSRQQQQQQQQQRYGGGDRGGGGDPDRDRDRDVYRSPRGSKEYEYRHVEQKGGGGYGGGGAYEAEEKIARERSLLELREERAAAAAASRGDRSARGGGGGGGSAVDDRHAQELRRVYLENQAYANDNLRRGRGGVGDYDVAPGNGNGNPYSRGSSPRGGGVVVKKAPPAPSRSHSNGSAAAVGGGSELSSKRNNANDGYSNAVQIQGGGGRPVYPQSSSSSAASNAARDQFFANREAAKMFKDRIEADRRGPSPGPDYSSGAGGGGGGGGSGDGGSGRRAGEAYGEDRIAQVRAQRDRLKEKEAAEKEAQLQIAYKDQRDMMRQYDLKKKSNEELNNPKESFQEDNYERDRDRERDRERDVERRRRIKDEEEEKTRQVLVEASRNVRHEAKALKERGAPVAFQIDFSEPTQAPPRERDRDRDRERDRDVGVGVRPRVVSESKDRDREKDREGKRDNTPSSSSPSPFADSPSPAPTRKNTNIQQRAPSSSDLFSAGSSPSSAKDKDKDMHELQGLLPRQRKGWGPPTTDINPNPTAGAGAGRVSVAAVGRRDNDPPPRRVDSNPNANLNPIAIPMAMPGPMDFEGIISSKNGTDMSNDNGDGDGDEILEGEKDVLKRLEDKESRQKADRDQAKQIFRRLREQKQKETVDARAGGRPPTTARIKARVDESRVVSPTAPTTTTPTVLDTAKANANTNANVHIPPAVRETSSSSSSFSFDRLNDQASPRRTEREKEKEHCSAEDSSFPSLKASDSLFDLSDSEDLGKTIDRYVLNKTPRAIVNKQPQPLLPTVGMGMGMGIGGVVNSSSSMSLVEEKSSLLLGQQRQQQQQGQQQGDNNEDNDADVTSLQCVLASALLSQD